MNEEFLYWFGLIAVIVSVNIPVLYVVKNVFSSNLINNLISIDCSGVLDDTVSVHVCTFRIWYNFVVNFLNRLLPFGIVAYTV